MIALAPLVPLDCLRASTWIDAHHGIATPVEPTTVKRVAIATASLRPFRGARDAVGGEDRRRDRTR
jgi:hypothetical protein